VRPNPIWQLSDLSVRKPKLRSRIGILHHMPLFYFDIEAGGSFVSDEEGQWFPTAEVAKREAVHAVATVIREMELDSLSITVRDEGGNTVGVASGTLETAVRPPNLGSQGCRKS
jgi:hypothetical protein